MCFTWTRSLWTSGNSDGVIEKNICFILDWNWFAETVLFEIFLRWNFKSVVAVDILTRLVIQRSDLVGNENAFEDLVFEMIQFLGGHMLKVRLGDRVRECPE